MGEELAKRFVPERGTAGPEEDGPVERVVAQSLYAGKEVRRSRREMALDIGKHCAPIPLYEAGEDAQIWGSQTQRVALLERLGDGVCRHVARQQLAQARFPLLLCRELAEELPVEVLIAALARLLTQSLVQSLLLAPATTHMRLHEAGEKG